MMGMCLWPSHAYTCVTSMLLLGWMHNLHSSEDRWHASVSVLHLAWGLVRQFAMSQIVCKLATELNLAVICYVYARMGLAVQQMTQHVSAKSV